jgi:hypothetical protein
MIWDKRDVKSARYSSSGMVFGVRAVDIGFVPDQGIGSARKR